MNFVKQKGAGLVEVMVSIFIATTSVLGLVELQGVVQLKHMESYQRAQAMVLLEGMVDNIISNRTAGQCYAITTATSGSPSAGTGNSTTYGCTDYGTSSTQAIAARDIALWDSLLKGSAESLGGASIGAMMGARGCISYDATNDIYTISVAWQGVKETVVNAANLCGQGSYGSEAKRRVVSVDVRLSSWS